MSICKKIMSDFEVAVSVDKVAVRVDIMVLEPNKSQIWIAWFKTHTY